MQRFGRRVNVVMWHAGESVGGGVPELAARALRAARPAFRLVAVRVAQHAAGAATGRGRGDPDRPLRARTGHAADRSSSARRRTSSTGRLRARASRCSSWPVFAARLGTRRYRSCPSRGGRSRATRPGRTCSPSCATWCGLREARARVSKPVVPVRAVLGRAVAALIAAKREAGVQELRIPATELSEEWVTPIGAADASDLRVMLDRVVYRGMLFSMGTIAVGLHQLNPAWAWSFAKLSARNLALATGVEVKLVGAENLPDSPASSRRTTRVTSTSRRCSDTACRPQRLRREEGALPRAGAGHGDEDARHDPDRPRGPSAVDRAAEPHRGATRRARSRSSCSRRARSPRRTHGNVQERRVHAGAAARPSDRADRDPGRRASCPQASTSRSCPAPSCSRCSSRSADEGRDVEAHRAAAISRRSGSPRGSRPQADDAEPEPPCRVTRHRWTCRRRATNGSMDAAVEGTEAVVASQPRVTGSPR